jgi:hypothetical protein
VSRLVPAYVEQAAWALYDGVVNELEPDELNNLAENLSDALIRGDAIAHAPDYVLVGLFGTKAPASGGAS